MDQKILKAVLMLRQLGNKYQSKEEQIAEQEKWLKLDKDYAEQFDEWIDWMRNELAKTPEQREEESRIASEMMAESEWEYEEHISTREYRDEWDDLWDDRARELGAVGF